MDVSKNIKQKDQYVVGLQIDNEIVLQRQKSYVDYKTRQQYYLENLIEQDNFKFQEVADVACGGGASCLLVKQKIPFMQLYPYRS